MNLEDVKSALLSHDIAEKIEKTHALYAAAQQGLLKIEGNPVIEILQPPLPQTITLTPQHTMHGRGVGSKQGHQALLHAILHIEFNAINLGLDAAYRFREMPYAYYVDWLRVAYEETLHFQLLSARLAKLGARYGDFPAHGGLWAMCVDTAHDVMIRMALVPRVMEARGLDVTPKIQQKLKSIKDDESVKILDTIYHDEIGHVAIGSHWFKYCCAQRGLSVYQTFRQLLKTYLKNGMDTGFNREARLQAGFDDMELALLAATFTEKE